MKPLTTLLFFCMALVVHAQPKILYYQPAKGGEATSRISKQDLSSDVNFWMQVMEESHVDLYHAISKQELLRQADQLLSALPDSVERTDATFTISRLAALLNEGHLGLAADPVTDSLYTWTALRFPYLLGKADSTGFFVRYDLSRNPVRLSPGARIIEVNGHSAADLFAEYSRFFGGLPEWKKVSVRDGLRKLLFMDRIRSPFSIVALQGKDTLRFIVDGYSYKEADSISAALSHLIKTPKPFFLEFLPGNIAVITFNDMDRRYRESFSSFLDSSFRVIEEKKAKGLIIDLRQNGGGDSELGEMLISYFNYKPYRSVSGVKIRISRHDREMSKLRGEDYSFKSFRDGEIYVHKVKELTRRHQERYHFNGKTAVLIGPATFSSANMLTNAIRDFQLARIFGEPTAEPGNDYGEVFPFMLPKTRIIARAAVKMFIRANGNEKDFDGIQPDVLVKDVRPDVDEEKEAAVKWLLQKKN